MREREAMSPRRRGLTLFEVVVALAIFLFSLVAISRLISLGGERALDVGQQGEASLLAQGKMAEILAGAESLQSSGGFTSFSENPDWQYRLECQQSDVPGLWNVQVWVQRQRPDGTAVEASLSRLVLHPGRRGSTLDRPGQGSSGGSMSGTSGIP